MAFTKLRQFFTDTAEDISSRSFKEFMGDFIPSNAHGRELYKAANDVISKKYTFASFLTNDKIRKKIEETGKSGPEIEAAINEFRKARATKDYKLTEETAKKLDQKHGITAFQEMLSQAEKDRNDTASLLIGPPDKDVYKGAGLREVYFNPDGEERIEKFVENFASDKSPEISNAIYKLNGFRNYFKNEDPALNRKRAVGVAGAYVAGSIGVRAIQGGTPLRNEYGESDIAGVPFL